MLQQGSQYKVINRDQWMNILEFSTTVTRDLDNYDVSGACMSRRLSNAELVCSSWWLLMQGPCCSTTMWSGARRKDKNRSAMGLEAERLLNGFVGRFRREYGL